MYLLSCSFCWLPLVVLPLYCCTHLYYYYQIAIISNYYVFGLQALGSNDDSNYHSNTDQNVIEQMSLEEAKEPDTQLIQRCQICYNEQINVLLLPCGHAKMCESCARQIISIQIKPCPHCQTPVLRIQRMYL